MRCRYCLLLLWSTLLGGLDDLRGFGGLGLGLAIVRDVAEIYGGGVTLGESEDLGGLLVRLLLPRAAALPA